MDNILPSNIGLLLKSISNPGPVDSSNFKKNELGALRGAYINSLSRVQNMPPEQQLAIHNIISELQKMHPDENATVNNVTAPVNEHLAVLQGKLSPSLQYSDYPKFANDNGQGIGQQSMLRNLLDPSYSAATSIGRANYAKDANGNIHVMDTYDFPGENKNTSLLSKLRGVMSNGQGWNGAFGVAHAFADQYAKPMPVDVQITNGATGTW